MAGFTSFDQIIAANSAGQTFKATWGKNFNPTAAAVANEYHTLFRGAGNPGADAIFNAGSTLVFQGVRDNTTNAGCIQHGGDVQASGYYKYLQSGAAQTAAATTVPGIIKLVDVIGFYRKTPITSTANDATTNTLGFGDTFTADAGTDIITMTSVANLPTNILVGTRVRLTTTTTLPAGLALATDYYVIKVTDLTFKLATSYANAIAGTAINITDAGTGTHTMSRLLPRYTNGAGVQAIWFNNNAVALGAATPNLDFTYVNSAQATGRVTPAVLPIGKTAASNSHIIYTGATGTGKYNYTMPLQAGDAGIAEITNIRNSVSYVSGEYTVALIKEIAEFPVSILGQTTMINFLTELPSFPRVYDGAALYWIYGSGVATPASSAFSGTLNFIWN